MQRKMLAWAIVGMMTWPAAASACDFLLAYNYMGIPASGMTVGAGLTVAPLNGDGDSYLVPSVDVGIPVGARAVVHPVLAYCSGDNDFGEIVFGAGGAFNIWNNADGNVHLNIQAHAARTGFDGGSEFSIPILASVLYNLNGGTSLFGSAGVQHYRLSFDEGDFDASDTNPAGAAGVQFSAGSMHISVGLTAVSGDDDTSLGAFGGIRIPFGA